MFNKFSVIVFISALFLSSYYYASADVLQYGDFGISSISTNPNQTVLSASGNGSGGFSSTGEICEVGSVRPNPTFPDSLDNWSGKIVNYPSITIGVSAVISRSGQPFGCNDPLGQNPDHLYTFTANGDISSLISGTYFLEVCAYNNSANLVCHQE